jgi:hypothetical protein
MLAVGAKLLNPAVGDTKDPYVDEIGAPAGVGREAALKPNSVAP